MWNLKIFGPVLRLGSWALCVCTCVSCYIYIYKYYCSLACWEYIHVRLNMCWTEHAQILMVFWSGATLNFWLVNNDVLMLSDLKLNIFWLLKIHRPQGTALMACRDRKLFCWICWRTGAQHFIQQLVNSNRTQLFSNLVQCNFKGVCQICCHFRVLVLEMNDHGLGANHDLR